MKIPENATDGMKRIPDWVKCVVCRQPPKPGDWLIEIVRHSNALIHQSCAAGRGKLVGLNFEQKEN